ncbi:MAG: hypothetical protein IJT73_07210 [Selenomonadaceae bacterium]|nr:hypothetical protein [Selenomonadaceae bacterium]
MTALKNFLAIFFSILLIYAPNVEAADKPRVMFMDLGAPFHSISQQLASDYLVESLVNSGNFIVMDFESLKEKIRAQRRDSDESNLSAARKIAEQSNIDFLIYGNFDRKYDDNLMLETKFEKQKFQSIQAVLIVRMMNVKTGEVVAVVKGEGISKRSELDAEDLKTLDNNKVPMYSVHNAIRKAAFDVVDKLIKDFPES